MDHLFNKRGVDSKSNVFGFYKVTNRQFVFIDYSKGKNFIDGVFLDRKTLLKLLKHVDKKEELVKYE